MPRLPNKTVEITQEISNPTQIDVAIRQLDRLLGRIKPVPSEWLKNGSPRASGEAPNEDEGEGDRPQNPDALRCLSCSSYETLVLSWKKAMKWTEGLDSALVCMLASSMSTNLVGEQLWFKILGPPSCGKTTILEGLSVNTEYVFSRDSIRGFYSGFKTDDGEDVSVAALARGKTLATKDGDTLLKAPNLTQILSEARGLYDRKGRTQYRNGISSEYLGHRMTWILCGTSSLREIDDSELGARFIDCVVMEEIDDEFEDDVSLRAAYSESNAMMIESTGDPHKQDSPELTNAMQLTGGYVGYLRRNAADLMSQVEMSDEALRYCTRLGKFIAFMRARPSKKGEENADREFAPRLVKQVVRLAKCIAVVTNQPEVNEAVINRVKKVAFDTSRGVTLDIVRKLAPSLDGFDATSLANHANLGPDRINLLLRFLRKIHVLEFNLNPAKNGAKINNKRYVLTERIRRLYHEVME